MPLRILRPDDIPGLTKFRGGIIARNGVGKTTWASTIPAVDPTSAEHRVVYASVDIENIRPVARLKHYRPVKIDRWNDMLDLYDLVNASLATPKPITDLVFDTWSRMQDLSIGKVVGYDPQDPEKLRAYIDRIPKSVHGWEGWGQVGALMNEWMANFNRLPVHIYYLLQENDRENKFDEVLETGPRLTPEAARGLKDALEVIGRMYVEVGGKELDVSGKEEDTILAAATSDPDPHHRRIDPDAREVRCLFIGQHDRYFAKGPSHLLGRVIRNPTWSNTVLPVLTQTPLPELHARQGIPPSIAV